MSQENNFIPNQDNYKPLTPFQLFVKSNFPFIENTFEALDNYGLYCKIVEYLNTVIANERTVEDNVTALYNAFVSLNTYVSDYFDNLDVQEEINNKLDELARDGTLENLMSQYIDDEVLPQLTRINNDISILSSRVDSLSNLEEGSTTGDAELIGIRVAQDGFVYATAGDSVRKQIQDVDTNIDITKNYFTYTEPTIVGAFQNEDLETVVESTTRFISPVLFLSGYYKLSCEGYSINLYHKVEGTTTFVKTSNDNGLQYNFDSQKIYRIIGRKADNSTITTPPYIKIEKLGQTIDLSKINNTINETNIIKESNKDLIRETIIDYDLDNALIETDKFYSRIDGVPTSSTGSETVTIEVKPNDEYYLTGQSVSNLSGAIFWDSTHKYVDHDIDFDDSLRHDFYDIKIIIPNGVYYMSVQTRDYTNYPVKIKKLEQQYTIPFDTFTSLKQNAYINKKLGYRIDTLNKCYITITVDDSNRDIDVIAKLMKTNYNYPLNLATIPSKIYNTVVGTQGIGKTVLDINKYVQENGGEILTHGDTPITSSNVDNFNYMYNIFSNGKRILEDVGLNVKGIILIGGTGEITNETTDIWAREYYQYSDRYGDSEPYSHQRTNIAKTNIDILKQMIDTAVENKTWLSLSFHGLYDYGVITDGTSAYANGFNESDFVYILNYIKNYTDNNQAQVVRYGYVYDNFGHFNP